MLYSNFIILPITEKFAISYSSNVMQFKQYHYDSQFEWITLVLSINQVKSVNPLSSFSSHYSSFLGLYFPFLQYSIYSFVCFIFFVDLLYYRNKYSFLKKYQITSIPFSIPVPYWVAVQGVQVVQGVPVEQVEVQTVQSREQPLDVAEAASVWFQGASYLGVLKALLVVIVVFAEPCLVPEEVVGCPSRLRDLS